MTWPVFAPVEMAGFPAILCDFRDLPLDWSDPSSPAMQAYALLIDAWEAEVGPIEETESEELAILFALMVDGAVVGAGVLHGVEIVSQEPLEVHVEGELLVASAVPGLAEAVEAGAEGFTATPADPDVLTSLRVSVR